LAPDDRSGSPETGSELVVRDRIELSTFRFSGSRVSAGPSVYTDVVCDPRATSVLDHDRLRKLRRVTMSSQSRQGSGDFSIAAIDYITAQLVIGTV
jgi:hypothetical protein